MAIYGKYYDFTEQLTRGKHDFSVHVFKVALSNGVPAATHKTRAEISELATANGYTSGGNTTAITISSNTPEAGYVTIVAADPATWTASGAGISYRYAALYNDTNASDALVAYWDAGSSTTVASGNTLKVDFAATLFTVF